MDGARVDRPARILARTPSRRAVVGLLTGFALHGALVPLADETVAAKRKCKPCQRKKRGTCRGRKPDGTRCGLDRECCRGRCVASCGEGTVRSPGTCRCCQTNLSGCNLANPTCCSAFCVDATPIFGVVCIGRGTDQGCDFDAQCSSNACVAGRCAEA